VPHVVVMLKHSKSWVRHSAVTALSEISMQRK